MIKKQTVWVLFTFGIIFGLLYFRFISPEGIDFARSDKSFLGGNLASKPKKKNIMQPPPPEAAVTSSEGVSFLPTKMEDPGKFAAFDKQIKDLAECLNMKVGTLDPQAEINFEYFNSLISMDLGDVISQTDQWSVTDVKTKNGEIHRIYIEYTTDPESEIKTRILKHIAFKSGGAQEELSLTPEQQKNPSDAFISSLEAEGEVISNSFARSILYQNGDELMLVEKNGHIYSYTLPHDGKTFKCSGVDSSKSVKCECE